MYFLAILWVEVWGRSTSVSFATRYSPVISGWSWLLYFKFYYIPSPVVRKDLNLTKSVTDLYLRFYKQAEPAFFKFLPDGATIFLSVPCNHSYKCCGSGSRSVGSGFVSQRTGYGSFFHHAKIVRKILSSTVCDVFTDFLSLKNNVKCTFKK
jgi:hypothetical protein